MCVSKCQKYIITIFVVIVPTLFSFFSPAYAIDSNTLRLHGLFSDHAVLQRGVEVPVWGTANPGSTVSVNFSGQNQIATADSEGQWMVKLTPLVANANGETMTVTSVGQTETRVDILVGEVWLASGQSNMTMGMFVADPFNPPSSIPSVENPSSFTPFVRLLQMNVGGTSTELSKDLTGNEKWMLSNRAGIYNFSSVGYYFGRTLNQSLDVPVGIIAGTAGGTSIRRWMPNSFLQPDSCSELSSGINYNYAIAPLLPYALKGVIWYQGESNANIQKIDCFYDDLTALIESWRSEWATAANTSKYDFPFYFVQLPNFEANEHSASWVKIREYMLRVSLETERTGMAVTIDVGDANDVHPRLKLPVGKRLARIARALDYGEDIIYSGPVFKSIALSGNTATLSFNHIGSGLVSSDAQSLKYFEIAGVDGVYYDALAVILNDAVYVRSDSVSSPVKVRYAWHTNPENPNFSNQEGLMASPFRTDAEFWGDNSNIGGNFNVAPVANDDSAGSVEVGGTIDFTVKDNDVDSDGDLSSASIVIVLAPKSGIATVDSASGEITYTNTGNAATMDTLSYLIVDTDGAISNEAAVSIIVTEPEPIQINEIPVTEKDSAIVQTGELVIVNVLANDNDSDGTLNKNSLLIVNQPSSGTVEIDFVIGKITYTHDGSATTSDSFIYTVKDDQGAVSNEGTVLITINSAASCGKGIELDGTNDFVNIPDLVLSSDFTIESWVKLAPGIDYRDGLFGNGSNMHLYFVSGKARLYAFGVRVTANTAISADTWSHIALIRSGTKLTMYVNGIKDATGNWNGSFSIKSLGQGYRGYFKGMMDEVRIWNVARTGSEIGVSYDTTVDPNALGLIGYWNFNGVDQIIADASSSANHASLGSSIAIGTDDPERLDTTAPLTESCGEGNAGGNSNEAPVANDDAVGSVEAGGSIGITVTDNDADNDGNLDPTSVTIVSEPSNGTATIDASGTISYTNIGTTAITDTLTYKVADTDGVFSNEATVSITITESMQANEAPVALADTATVQLNGSVTIQILENDSDDGTLVMNSLKVVSAPNYGTVDIDFINGEMTYTHDGSAASNDSFTYKITDEQGAESNEAIVSITITSLAASCGKGIELDGINDWVNIPDLTLTNDFTIEGWVKLAPGIDNKDALFGQEGSGSDINFYQGKVRLFAGGDQVTANTALLADTWGHIAITRLSGSLTLYVNGVEDATGIWNGNLSLKALGRGNRGYFKGMIDEIRVWNVARTGAEINASYGSSVSPGVFGLIGYWKFSEIGQTVIDTSSSVNHGSLGASTLIGIDDPVRLDSIVPLSENCDGGDTGGNSNVAPLANNDAVGSVEAGGTISFIVTGNDMDSDGNLNPASVEIVSVPNNGTATVDASGTITYFNAGSTATTDSIGYKVADTDGIFSNEATVSITVTEPMQANEAPVALADTATVQSNGSVTIQILDNDSDDSTLDMSSLKVVSAPTYGTVDIDFITGEMTYVHDGSATAKRFYIS